MIVNLRYGAEATLRLELPSEVLVAHCDAPRGRPLARLADAVDSALAEPIEFPPLARAVVPGDKVVLALIETVPEAATIVARTVHVLVSAGVSPGDITLLLPDDANSADPLATLSAEQRAAIHCQTHEPANRQELGYLGASQAGEAIYVNRALHDADLVLSIGCLRLDESLGYDGFRSGVYPTFADAASLARYRAPRSNQRGEHEKLLKAAEEVHWLLGMQFTIQVVPAAGGGVSQVLAGELIAVFREGARQCRETWSYDVPARAGLVMATIEGDALQQTWDNVARALAAASHAVHPEGAIVVCCELSEKPGPAMQLVAGSDDMRAALRAMAKRASSDVPAAAEVVRALSHGPVYLLSRLDEATVEELGMVPLSAKGLSRLASRHDSCIVLANAQHAVARPGDEHTDLRSLARTKSSR